MRRSIAAAMTVACVADLVGARQPPAFRTATDLVEVDVVVQDRSGRFVADLAAEDFDVREDGRSQAIDSLYVVDRDAVRANGGAGSASDLASPAAAAARAPRVFVLVFDDEHLAANGFKRAQAAAVSLVTSQLHDGDVAGIVASGRMVNGRLTSNREEILAAARALKPSAKSQSRRMDEQQWPRVTEAEAFRIATDRSPDVLAEAVRRACADDLGACQSRFDVEGQVRQKAASIAGNARMATERTLQALTALMNGLSAIDGRKNVLFFSEGILAEQEWPLVERTIGLAARANARIYTLDARGLDRSQMGDRLAGVDPGGQGGMLEVLKALDEASDSINSLAVDTGGFVIRNQNELTSAVARIAAEASRYYVLGYRSDHTPDGSFRRLAVRVNKPGLVVRARRGYVATPKQAPSPTDAATSTRTTGLDAAAAAAHPEGPAPRPNSGEASREGTDRAGGDRAGPDVSGSATSAAGPEEARRADSSNSLATSPSTSVKTPDARLRPGAATHVERLAPSSASRDADADAGWDAYKRGDLENARRSLGTAAARPSAAPWVHYALGQSAYALRQFADAVSAWETVRRTTPEFEPVYFDLVDGYLQQKDYDKATRVLRDAQKRWPRDADVLNALGVVQVARGSLDDAVDSFERAIGAAPAEAVAYFNLAKAAELRYWKYRRFVTQTRQWIANGNDRTKAIENYKRYLEKGGPLENAARDGLSRLEWNSRQ